MPAPSASAFEPIPLPLLRRAPDAFAEALGRAFEETGFAVIRDHGVDPAVIDRALLAAKAFFALPVEAKRAYHAPDGAGQRGYTPFAVEVAKGAAARDLKEFWHVGRELPAGDPLRAVMADNVYVREVEGWKKATGALYAALEAVGLDLLAAIARRLALPTDFFEDPVRNGNSVLRLLHYPAQDSPPPEGSVRAGAHEDINVITLLLGAEEGGLEVLHRSGAWLAINPPPGSLVVNIGDMLQRLTCGRLPSTTHRVVNPRPERARFARYSTPFFLHFRPDYLIRPLETCALPGKTPPAPITAQDFLMQRLREIGLAS